MNKPVVRVNLRENFEVFNSEFSVLTVVRNGKIGVRNLFFNSKFMGIVRNGKLRVGKPPSLINVPQSKLRGFHILVLGIVQNGKLRVEKLVL